MTKKTQQTHIIPRPPVVAVMGHIDHGKSTLLDYIRKTNVAEKEAGGITQHISAYEFTHISSEAGERKITFLDTPGHEAFSCIRTCGACVADIAILVVSAEDGVKPQTLEAYKYIKEANTPFIIAITKIDLPTADSERAKQSLSENGIYLEGYGGDISHVALSSKTGEHVDELLDLIIFVADFEELSASPDLPAEAVVIESGVDKNKGTSASIILKNGTLRQGMAVATPTAYTPVRIMEDFTGSPTTEATVSSPLKLYGWNTIPKTGDTVVSFQSRKEAENYVANHKEDPRKHHTDIVHHDEECTVIPIIVVADTAGTLEAITEQITTLSTERVHVLLIGSSTGAVTEAEVKTASAQDNACIVAFNTSIDTAAHNAAERFGIDIQTFSVIYHLLDWIKEQITKRTPVEYEDETHGKAQLLKIFNKNKSAQVVGGKVTEGVIAKGDTIKIFRRGEEIGSGTLKELQQQQIKTEKVEEGNECGLMIESRKELASGDTIESFYKVRK